MLRPALAASGRESEKMAVFQIDPDRSTLIAEATSNVHPIRIETLGLQGVIEAEVANGSLQLEVAPRARLEIDVELLKSGIQLYDMEIQRLVEGRKYPRVRGELLETEELRPGSYRLRGKLSFHGVTSEVDGEVTVRVRDDELEIEGQKTFDMRDFNLDPPRILMLRVDPDVVVRAKVVAVRDR